MKRKGTIGLAAGVVIGAGGAASYPYTATTIAKGIVRMDTDTEFREAVVRRVVLLHQPAAAPEGPEADIPSTSVLTPLAAAESRALGRTCPVHDHHGVAINVNHGQDWESIATWRCADNPEIAWIAGAERGDIDITATVTDIDGREWSLRPRRWWLQ